ncbi:MAG: 4-hydroxybenzoate polyprenyltransferase-like prenyltransferase [Myxococcaceae bacterium]|nr:4-hydroxybenzoate polyprenyltransferase-like prenyltransferase [Myxococcaceae bacterium]
MTEALVVRPPLALSALKALRIKQWTKNGVLLAPLLFAKGVVREGLPLKSATAVAAFCLLASGVYLVNDWADQEKDRHHPEKRHRPIAAGLLSLPVVLALVAVCWGGAAALGLWLGTPFLGVCLAYLALQALYTWGLKKAVILDVMGIALGFILRVVAGAVAIDVMVSNWLFLCTLLGALFLGFAKRRHELSSLEGAAGAHRANLEDYSLPMLDQMMSISAASTILAYGLYTVSSETVEHVGSDRLKFTVPLVVYGMFRYLFLVHKRGAGGSPEKVLLSDAPLIIDIVLIVALAAWALYFPR